MTTQAQTLRQRFEALAKWEKVCSEHRMVSIGSSGLFCDICKGTGKALVLPGLRKPCHCWHDFGGCKTCWVRSRGIGSVYNQECSCTSTAIPGWVLRGDPDTEDGRLPLFGVLQQALLELVDEVKIGRWSPIPEFHVELSHEGGHCWVKARGPTALEALVDAAMKLKEAQP